MNTPETPAAPALSFPRRAIGIFFSPAQVFDYLRERPTWLAPVLAVVVITVVLFTLVPAELLQEMMQEQAGARGGEVTPEQLETMAKFGQIMGYAGAVVWPFLQVLVVSLLLLLIFTLFAGGEARFKQYAAVSAHTLLIQALGGIVTTPIAIAREDLQARLSFALLVPGLESGFAYHFLNGITVFGLWMVVVLGIGASRVSRATGTGTAVGIVLGLYGLWVIGSAGFASAFGG